MKRNKVIILASIIVGVLVVTLGLTYAAITFNETKGNSQLVLGDIWMHYGETNQLVLNDAMPIDINDYITYKVNPVMASQEVVDNNELSRCVEIYNELGYEFDEGSDTESFCKGTGTAWGNTIQGDLDNWINWEETEGDGIDGFLKYGGQDLLDAGVILQEIENLPLPYFEFTIDGKNTYDKKDIWYEIVLNHGDEHATRTTRIRDDLLKFRLVEVNNNVETELLTNKSYASLENKRIYVDTIPANTNEEINRTYRLYMWISEDTVIGNVEEDYTIEEWNDVYASIKVNVTGDFNEKDLRENFVNLVKSKYGSDTALVAVNTDGDLYDGTGEIREYRYSGEIVNNYVFFDTNGNGKKEDNEIWRIVGLFNDNGEEKIKLVRNRMLMQNELPSNYVMNERTYLIAYDNTISDGVFWNYPTNVSGININDWTTAGLQYYLNTKNDESIDINAGYLSFFTDKAVNLMSLSTYYLGNIDEDVSTVKQIYEQEKDETKPWNGVVGLMYPSDYGYSANNEYWTTDMYGWAGSEASSTSWLYQTTDHNNKILEWFISPSSKYSDYAIVYENSGSVSHSLVSDCYYGIKGARPTIYLKSTVDIIDGDGTERNPFVVLIK